LRVAIASLKGNVEIVKLLLENGAEVNAEENALHAAAYQGNEVILKLLLEYGAEVNAGGGEYALQAALVYWQGSEAIVKLLLENGAEVNAEGGGYGKCTPGCSIL
jgi:ankyrin repeat protein